MNNALLDHANNLIEEVYKLRAENTKLREESTAFQNQCISLKHKNHLLREQRDRLVAHVEHTIEYWNGSENEAAMADALHHIDAKARAILAEIGEKK